jgi:hypothetical protein
LACELGRRELIEDASLVLGDGLLLLFEGVVNFGQGMILGVEERGD